MRGLWGTYERQAPPWTKTRRRGASAADGAAYQSKLWQASSPYEISIVAVRSDARSVTSSPRVLISRPRPPPRVPTSHRPSTMAFTASDICKVRLLSSTSC